MIEQMKKTTAGLNYPTIEACLPYYFACTDNVLTSLLFFLLLLPGLSKATAAPFSQSLLINDDIILYLLLHLSIIEVQQIGNI